MSVVTVAAEKLQRDVGGIPSARQASGPVAEPIHVATTDLGNLEHIFTGAGLVQNLTENVSTALTKATGSIRGPHGGLIPSVIQHTPFAGITRDGSAELVAAANRGTQDASTLVDRARTALVALRVRLHV